MQHWKMCNIKNKTRKDAKVEYLDYQIPLTQLKGYLDTRDLNIWLCGRQSDY